LKKNGKYLKKKTGENKKKTEKNLKKKTEDILKKKTEDILKKKYLFNNLKKWNRTEKSFTGSYFRQSNKRRHIFL